MSGRTRAMGRARRRDRRVYLASHPLLLVLLSLAHRRPVLRLRGTVLVNGEAGYREALTRLPLDRLAAGTTGAIARELATDGQLLFDQEGSDHRGTRRSVSDDLGAAAVRRLRPVWQAVLDERLSALARGETVDIVDVARQMAGATVAAMSTVDANPFHIARLAGEAAAASLKEHLSGRRFGGSARRARAAAEAATARLNDLVGSGPCPGLATVLAVTAVTTTVSGLPRSVAWCADAGLWREADCDASRAVLVDELLRVVAPVPVVTRVAGADGTVDGHAVRKGDKILLVARHAVAAHRRDPDCTAPAPAATAQLIFGAGGHACPGARLARAQLDDALRALSPYWPVVVRSTVDKRSALPGWRSLLLRAGEPR
jgi:cytochrome P450